MEELWGGPGSPASQRKLLLAWTRKPRGVRNWGFFLLVPLEEMKVATES